MRVTLCIITAMALAVVSVPGRLVARTPMDHSGPRWQTEFITLRDADLSGRLPRDERQFANRLQSSAGSDQRSEKAKTSESDTREKKRQRRRQSPWKISEHIFEKLTEGFSGGEALQKYVIRPGEGKVLVKATFKISTSIPDKEAIEKYNEAANDLSEEVVESLTKEYRFFSLKNLTLRTQTGVESRAVFLNRPAAASEMVIGVGGQGAISVRGSSPKGWLQSEALWIADGAVIGKEKVKVDWRSNKYLCLVETNVEPVEIEAIFMVDDKVKMDDVQIVIDTHLAVQSKNSANVAKNPSTSKKPEKSTSGITPVVPSKTPRTAPADDRNRPKFKVIPKEAKALYRLAVRQDKEGLFEGALRDYDKAIQLAPNYISALNNRAWLRATCPDARFRNGDQALGDAKAACELTEWKVANKVGTLAASYAEAGDFKNAMKWQKKAISLAPGNKRLDYQARLSQYKAGQPYRTPPR